MRPATTRRSLLAGLAGLSLTGPVGAAGDQSRPGASPTQSEQAFDPARQGFEFRDWSTRGAERRDSADQSNRNDHRWSREERQVLDATADIHGEA